MSDSIVAVIVLPSFAQDTRKLKKKYRHLLKDLQPTIEQPESGETPGDQITRVIYYLKTTTNCFSTDDLQQIQAR